MGIKQIPKISLFLAYKPLDKTAKEETINSYLCTMSNQEIQDIIIKHLRDFNPEYIGIFGSYS